MLFSKYIQSTSLPIISSDYIFFNPHVPDDKLNNALDAYGHNLPQNEIVALIDDTFWGSAKEGILITNDSVLLSKGLSKVNRFQFQDINQISCDNKNVIINNKVVAKLTYAEKMHLGFLFSVLNKYLDILKNSHTSLKKNKLDEQLTDQLLTLLFKTQNTPIFYDPNKNKTLGESPQVITKIPSLLLLEDLSLEQIEFISFKLALLEEEKILSVSYISNSSDYSDFFCITDYGLYIPRDNKGNSFISFEDLKDLKVISEDKISNRWQITFDNGITALTSIQNSFVKPFSKQLVNNIIYLLNNGEISFTSDDSAETINTNNQEKTTLNQSQPNLKLRFIHNDEIFKFIKTMNRVDKVSSFFLTPSNPKDAPLTKLKEDFQSLLVKSVATFRKEITENGGVGELANDYATLEVITFTVAFCRITMNERGIDPDITNTIILEGLKLTFNETGDWRNNNFIKVVNRFEKEYWNENELIGAFMLRLFFGNLAETLNFGNDPQAFMENKDFNPEDVMEGFTCFGQRAGNFFERYGKQLEKDTHYQIDKSIDLLWSLR